MTTVLKEQGGRAVAFDRVLGVATNPAPRYDDEGKAQASWLVDPAPVDSPCTRTRARVRLYSHAHTLS